MLMTTARLIALRLYNVTLGHSRAGAALLHRQLVNRLIRKSGNDAPYCASARFFDPKELD